MIFNGSSGATVPTNAKKELFERTALFSQSKNIQGQRATAFDLYHRFSRGEAVLFFVRVDAVKMRFAVSANIKNKTEEERGQKSSFIANIGTSTFV